MSVEDGDEHACFTGNVHDSSSAAPARPLLRRFLGREGTRAGHVPSTSVTALLNMSHFLLLLLASLSPIHPLISVDSRSTSTLHVVLHTNDPLQCRKVKAPPPAMLLKHGLIPHILDKIFDETALCQIWAPTASRSRPIRWQSPTQCAHIRRCFGRLRGCPQLKDFEGTL